MDFVSSLQARCQVRPKTLALPESNDPRILRAGLELLAENVVSKLYFFHAKDVCQRISRNFNQVFDLNDPRLVWYDEQQQRSVVDMVRAKLPKGKKLSPLHVACYLVGAGELDTLCAGATYTTADVIRAGLAYLPLTHARTVTSSFLLSRKNRNWLFADCAVIVDPTPEQLMCIATATLETFKLLLPSQTPRFAFLSFSSKGSANHAHQQKVKQATALMQEQFPQLVCDGELQFDTAVDPAVAYSKSPQSKLRGNANCFIFPNLDAGNIGYKICQRLGNFSAFGPILQGFAKPICDLSRGASTHEIKAAAYISLCRVA